MGLIKDLIKIGVGAAALNSIVKTAKKSPEQLALEEEKGQVLYGELSHSKVLNVSIVKKGEIWNYLQKEIISSGYEHTESTSDTMIFEREIFNTKIQLVIGIQEVERKLVLRASQKIKSWILKNGYPFTISEQDIFKKQINEIAEQIETLFGDKKIMKGLKQKFCKECGGKIDASAKFCSGCGNKI